MKIRSFWIRLHGHAWKGVSWLWLSPLWWTLWHFGRCCSLCRASEALHIFGTQTAPVGASHSGATTLRPAVDFCLLKIEGKWKWVSKREATANGNVGEVKASLEDKGYYDILFNHQNSYSPRCRAKLQEQNSNTSNSWCNSISSEASAPSSVHLVEFHAGIILGSLPPKVVHHILVHQKFMQPGANMLYHAGMNFGASGCPYEVVMSFKQHDGCHLFCFAQALRPQSGSLQLRCKCTSQQSERIVNVAQHAHWHVKPQQYLAFARSEIQSGYHSTSFHYSWTSTPQTQCTIYCSDPSLSILVPGHLPSHSSMLMFALAFTGPSKLSRRQRTNSCSLGRSMKYLARKMDDLGDPTSTLTI